jgi:hypothetical protein
VNHAGVIPAIWCWCIRLGGHHVSVVRDPEGVVMPSGSFKSKGFRFEVFGFQ